MKETGINFLELKMQLSLNFKQVAHLIAQIGAEKSVIVQGEIGIGKSSILTLLGQKFPNHTQCYMDCTTKDLGDLMLPKMAVENGMDISRFAPNEEFGMHTGKPVILMLDEFGKANRSVQNACLRMLLERKIGMYSLPEGSIVFGTTNLAAEGVGDTIQPHARNRVVFVEMRKPTADEWLEWAVDAELEPELLAWVNETPHCLASFKSVTTPSDNQYIFHPKEARPSFVTPRSLEAASQVIAKRHHIDNETLICSLAGTVGVRAALDMQAFITLADQLPSWESIIKSPATANVPDDAAARCMLVFTALGRVDKETIEQWLEYMNRLPKEAQALFGLQAVKTAKRTLLLTNKSFLGWVTRCQYLIV